MKSQNEVQRNEIANVIRFFILLIWNNESSEENLIRMD